MMKAIKAAVDEASAGMRIDDALMEGLRRFLAKDRMVKFAYLFGSAARNEAGPLSDLDVAVYLDGRVNEFRYRLRLAEGLARALKTEKLDLVVLKSAPVLLKYEVISSGIILKEDRPRRVMFETLVLQEYLDTAYLRKVQLQYLQEQMKGGTFFG